MYWLDIIIGVPLLLYAIVGFAKGFVRSFASFAALMILGDERIIKATYMMGNRVYNNNMYFEKSDA
jgi:ABC-type sulfate transport system permease component